VSHPLLCFATFPQNNVHARSVHSREPVCGIERCQSVGICNGFVEFACLAEALIAADEYGFWASAAGG